MPALDGLRGIAALVVVVHHGMLTIAPFAAAYSTGRVIGTPASSEWWLLYSPLHLIWDGPSAVLVFFVLSGLVLSRSVADAGVGRWVAYYPQRLIRLYVPTIAAVALTVVNIVVVPRTAVMNSSWLVDAAHSVSRWSITADLSLTHGHGYLLSPLWSLHWELVFSLLLPLFVVLGSSARFRLGRWACFVGITVAMLVGAAAAVPWLQFLPVFLVGVIIMVGEVPLRAALQRCGRRRVLVLAAAALLALSAPWLLRGVGLSAAAAADVLPLTVAGAALLVVVVLGTPSAEALLRHRLLQWLGAISFSLYLVHEPVVIASAYLFGEGRQLIAVPVGVLVSLGLAVVFRRCVERPAHRLAVLSGRAVHAALERAGAARRMRRPNVVVVPGPVQGE